MVSTLDWLIAPAYAATAAECAKPTGLLRLDRGIPGGFDGMNSCAGSFDLNIFTKIVVNLIQVGLQFAGIVAVIMLIVGGITYIVSRGRPDLMEKAYNTLKYAIVGVVVVILSYVFVYGIDSFVSGRLE